MLDGVSVSLGIAAHFSKGFLQEVASPEARKLRALEIGCELGAVMGCVGLYKVYRVLLRLLVWLQLSQLRGLCKPRDGCLRRRACALCSDLQVRGPSEEA